MVGQLIRNWWIPVVRGALGILFGLLVFAYPQTAVTVFVYLFGAYMLLDGIVALAMAFDVSRGRGWLILSGIAGIETIAAHPRREHRRGDFGLEPRQHDPAAISGRRAMQRFPKRGPRQPKLIADPFARERPVLETGQAHVIAGWRTKHVTRPRPIDPWFTHQAEHRVAGAERDRQRPFANQTDTDETARIVPGPGHHLRRRQTET